MPTVFFQTFGCQMNVADSNEFEELLFLRGFIRTADPATADLLVVNTCSVREHAEQRAKARIFEYSRLKKKGARLWVVGCMAERLGDSLKETIPGISRVIGAKSVDLYGSVIDEEFQHIDEALPAVASSNEASDYVSVMRGCDNYCAYCIVPYVRGHEASISHESILESIRRKVDSGVVEITLLGQNVNSYNDHGVDFPDLLSLVAEIDGVRRIRFTTSHPKDCSEKLIRTVASEPKCCRHFHLPVQAGSDRVLATMNRRYTSGDYRKRIAMIREYIPEADITTDILVGFPGESDMDFEETLSLVRDVKFTTAFMFAYSVREGTKAAEMKDSVSAEVKQDRLRRLIELQTKITRDEYAAMIGKTLSLMLSARQEKRDRLWMATDFGSKRALIACDNATAGTILEAQVSASSGMTLLCERVSE